MVLNRDFINIHGKRIVVCIGFATVALLLIGAGKIKEGFKADTSADGAKVDKLQEVIASMNRDVPIEHRDAWKALSSSNPGLIVRISTVEMRPVVKMD